MEWSDVQSPELQEVIKRLAKQPVTPQIWEEAVKLVMGLSEKDRASFFLWHLIQLYVS